MLSFLLKPHYMSSWNYRIRMTYWILSIILIIGLLLLIPVVKTIAPEFYPQYMFKQVYVQISLLFILIIAAEWLYKRFAFIQDYIVISFGACFSDVALIFNYSESVSMLIALILPVVASILYFNYRKVLYASLVTLIPFIIVMPLDPFDRLDNPIRWTFIGICVIVGTSIATCGIVNRGLKLIQNEKEALVNERNHRLQQLAIQEAYCKDALTGLDNHKRFQERLRAALDDADRAPVHLAVIDIDNFKSVNDTYGHSNGDLVLRKVGALLKEIEAEGIQASRYGGEEFTVIFSGMETVHVLERLEFIRAGTERLSFPELGGGIVTVSIGYHAAGDSKDASALFQQADKALYSAKRSGKNQVRSAEQVTKNGGGQG
ncbi:GGDEF domain-containing protein [Paenibacillus sp. PL2-23]|uniref:GGDEF domain-containing protein n=1 Tax=Paenibacillus sp. PL2-23 TaxID=2100729 RepID=UPI0030F917A4